MLQSLHKHAFPGPLRALLYIVKEKFPHGSDLDRVPAWQVGWGSWLIRPWLDNVWNASRAGNCPSVNSNGCWLSPSNFSVKDLATSWHLRFNVYHDTGQSEELTFGIQILEFIRHDKNIKIRLYPNIQVFFNAIQPCRTLCVSDQLQLMRLIQSTYNAFPRYSYQLLMYVYFGKWNDLGP